MAGTLYVVATPIGHLDDMTHRALQVLSQVDLIAAEDTRHTRKLLQHYQIQQSLVSYHEHNERQRAPQLLKRLESGESVALVSDAGTPTVSDPGYHLIGECVAAGIPIVPIPGPSAILAALSASGLPTHAYFFGGFLPVKSGPKRRALERVQGLPATLIFFESPHRLAKTLALMEEVLGERQGVVARELTKRYEEFQRGSLAELAEQYSGKKVRGEVTILLGPPD